MKKQLILFASCVLLTQANAQNHEDVFRYSLYNYQGTPRTMATAGAWGAVGADLSSASINPAGIALYRRNEAMAAMSINSFASDSKYGTDNQQAHDYRLGFNIPNFGFVLNQTNQYMGRDAKQGLVSYQFAFGMNRLADFQQNINFAGNVKNTSVSDYFAQLANGIDSSNFTSSDYDNTLYALAWRMKLIDNLPNDPKSYASIQKLYHDTDYTMLQTEALKNRGRMYEWYISGGLNLSNIIYLGGSFIIQDVNYSSEINYQESLIKSSVVNNIYKSGSFTNSISTKGSGFGGRIGMIIRPNDYFRVGFSYQTPVILNLKDEYSSALSAAANNGITYSQPAEKRVDNIEYSVTTPGRLGIQTAIILPQLGLISFDYDLVDYSTGRISSDKYQLYFLAKNAEMSRKYQAAANYRVGLEAKADFMKLRAGYAYMGSPYNPNEVSEANGCRHLYSAGLGFALDEQVSFDFGLNYLTGKNFYKTFETNTLSATTQYNRIMFAIGSSIKF